MIPHLMKYKKQKSLELSGKHFPKTDLPLKPFLRLLETQVQLLKLELECFKLSECEDLVSVMKWSAASCKSNHPCIATTFSLKVTDIQYSPHTKFKSQNLLSKI